MSDNITELMAKIRINQFNHHNQQHIALDYLEARSRGEVVLENGTSPIVALLEHNTACCANNNIAVDSLFRDLTREHAKTIDGLVRFLDAKDKIFIASKPSRNVITLALSVADIAKLSIPIDNGGKRLVIPENTVFSYKDEMYYGIHHAIQVTYHADDNIDVSYLDNDNPLYELENPVLDTNYRSNMDLSNKTGILLLEINIDVFQFTRSIELYTINKTTGFSQDYVLKDQYYHARVFYRSNNTWKEMETVLGEFAYNPNSDVPTALVHLNGNSLRINIPQIYINRGVLGSQVKVVMYTTKGDVRDDYLISTPDDFSCEFRNDDTSLRNLVGPLSAFGTAYVYSRGKCTGGVNMPTIDEIRNKLMHGVTDGSIPITRAKLKNTLSDLDYDLVHEHNYADHNLYVASKRLDPVSIGPTKIQVASGGLNVMLADSTNYHGFYHHGNDIVITPKMVCEYNDGRVRFLTNGEVDKQKRLTLEELVIYLNGAAYLTTPFYYLIAQGKTTHECAVFDLDSPKVASRQFVTSNRNSSGLISTSEYAFEKRGNTYYLTVTAIVNDTFLNFPDDAFIPQLQYIDSYNNMFGFNGKFKSRTDDGAYVFEFEMPTEYELRLDDTMVVTPMVGPSGTLHMPLDSTVNITYNLIKQLPPVIDDDLKSVTNPGLLPEYYQTVTHERFNLILGSRLKELYTPTRSLVGTPTYQVYESDVLAFWKEDVLLTDDAGYAVFNDNPDYDANDPDSDPYIYTVLHNAGDPVMDASGKVQVVKHHKGDLIRGDDGEPILTGRTKHTILTRIIMIDYKYTLTGDYMEYMRDRILYQLTTDIAPLQGMIIDMSLLKYNLSNCLGRVKVRHDRNRSFDIPAGLSFTFVVNVDPVTYADTQLRSVITNSIKSITSEYMVKQKYARNELTTLIDNSISSSVSSFDIQQVCGRSDIIGFTLEDPSDLVGIAGVIRVDTDGNLQLTDAIDVIFEIV